MASNGENYTLVRLLAEYGSGIRLAESFLVVLVVVLVVLVLALRVVVVASHYCYRESHHQDHQNHHQEPPYVQNYDPTTIIPIFRIVVTFFVFLDITRRHGDL